MRTSRGLWWTAVVLVLLAIVVYGSGWWLFGRHQWVPVSTPIEFEAGNQTSAHFEVPVNGNYEVHLSLARMPASESIVESSRRVYEGAPFEIRWSIVQEGRAVARGNSADKVSSTRGSRDAVGVTLGTFSAQAGRSYQVNSRVESSVPELADANPTLVVSADTSRSPFHSRFFLASMMAAFAAILGLLALVCVVAAGIRTTINAFARRAV